MRRKRAQPPPGVRPSEHTRPPGSMGPADSPRARLLTPGRDLLASRLPAGHVRGVSQPEQTHPGAGGVEPAPQKAIFRAYTEQQRTRVNRRALILYPAALVLIIGLGTWTVKFEPEATPFRVETAWGLRTVLKGMSPQEVSGILGQPTSKERRGNQECYQYGRPSIKVASFVLHVVCYEDGKLREVSEKRYNSWVVTQDLAISPAPLEAEETPPPESPAPSSAPNVAGKTE